MSVRYRGWTPNEWAEYINEWAERLGWNEPGRTIGDLIALMHSELSEALEEARKDNPIFYVEKEKPEGIAVELIDCMIRILHWCAQNNIDVDYILQIKMEYNEQRKFRHGGKKF